MARRELQFRSPTWGHAGVDLTVTRKGVELGGHYDGGYGGMEGFAVTWEDLEAARKVVDAIGIPIRLDPRADGVTVVAGG